MSADPLPPGLKKKPGGDGSKLCFSRKTDLRDIFRVIEDRMITGWIALGGGRGCFGVHSEWLSVGVLPMLKWKADQQSGEITHSGQPSSVRPYCVCEGGWQFVSCWVSVQGKVVFGVWAGGRMESQ